MKLERPSAARYLLYRCSSARREAVPPPAPSRGHFLAPVAALGIASEAATRRSLMLTKGHLLVVEDDSDIRTAMVAILEDEGFQVTAHEDGRSALEFLRASVTALPSLILLDLMMPIMNGWEFREQQLADPKLDKIPVVVVTAHDPRQQLANRCRSHSLQARLVRNAAPDHRTLRSCAELNSEARLLLVAARLREHRATVEGESAQRALGPE